MTRRGQATVEWAAVLMIAIGLAVGMGSGLHRAMRALPPLSPLLAGLAVSTMTRQPVTVSPGVDLPELPIVDAGSIVAVARSAAAAGIAEVPPGSNRGPGVDAFTDGHAEAWCADFVSWVLRAAGHPFTGGASAGWRLAWTGDVRSWFAARGLFRDRLAARPQPGDVVWFVHGHVGIVEQVHGDVLHTIEGNAGDAVARRAYPAWRLRADIGGFGRVPLG